MAIIQPPSMISEGKLAGVILFALIAGIIIGLFIGFLVWRAHILPSPLALMDQARISLTASIMR